jgi:hypothetical protein
MSRPSDLPLANRDLPIADHERGRERQGGADGTTPPAHIAQHPPSAAKRSTAALMIVETFFLVEEKRAIHTRIFQDLFEHVTFGW